MSSLVAKALETIKSSENLLGTHPELDKRKKFIAAKMQEHREFLHEESDSNSRASDHLAPSMQKIDLLKDLLHKIESRR